MKTLISILAICVMLSGCAHVCPTGEQLPFNVDPSLLTPPEKLQTIDVSPAVSDQQQQAK